MKLLTSTFLLVAMSTYIVAQQKPSASKFDELQLDDVKGCWLYDKSGVSDRIDRLFNKVKTMTNVKVYILVYKARKIQESRSNIANSCAYTTWSKLVYEGKLREENVVQVAAGFRDSDTLEYWIGSTNSDPPPLTPTYRESETFECPNLSISADGMNMDEKSPATFSASTYPKHELRFRWSSSAGEIVGDRENATIKINAGGAKRLTVFVEALGLPLPCERVAYGTFDLGIRPYLVDTMSQYNVSELTARFQAFMTQVANNPNMTGYVLTYGGRNYDGAWERNLALQSIKRMIIFLKLDPSRVKVVDGGYREFDSVDMWLLPPNVEAPAPTPSVDRVLLKPKSTKPKKSGSSRKY